MSKSLSTAPDRISVRDIVQSVARAKSIVDQVSHVLEFSKIPEDHLLLQRPMSLWLTTCGMSGIVWDPISGVASLGLGVGND